MSFRTFSIRTASIRMASIRMASILMALVASGCGGTLGARAAHARAESDLFSDAIAEAVDAHAHVVGGATRMTFASEAEADAVARSLARPHFRRVLARTLALRGSSLRELDEHARRHPGFVEAQRARHGERLRELERALGSLWVEPQPVTPFDDADDADDAPAQVATLE